MPESASRTGCTADHEAVSKCNLVAFELPLPAEFQVNCASLGEAGFYLGGGEGEALLPPISIQIWMDVASSSISLA